jgi:uncharacterized protein YjbI with pentapeptide repeats
MGFFNLQTSEIITRLVQELPFAREFKRDSVAELERLAIDLTHTVSTYIVPFGQSVNPADDPDEDTAAVATENVLNIMDRYLGKPAHNSHLFVLSDAGMGKTSLLTILKLAHLCKLTDESLDVRLYKIGPQLVSQLETISSPSQTVVLLDALDEDAVAWREFDARVQEILLATKSFRKTIVTCRTQFFPWKHEKDSVAAGKVVLFGHQCSKLFLSPFTDEQVSEYINNRFSDQTTRDKATAIVGRMRSLKFRPMLLAYVDLLIDRHDEFNTTFDLYAALVDAWLDREMAKGRVSDTSPLFKACKLVAAHMYENKNQQPVSHDTLTTIIDVDDDLRNLEEMTVEGRALLHRTSDGHYKFAHQSLLEYFVTVVLLEHPTKIRTSDQIKAFLIDCLMSKTLDRLGDLDLSGVTLNHLSRPGLKATAANLTAATFNSCDFTHGVFKGADLSQSRFIDCKLDHANFSEADLGGCFVANGSIGGLLLRDARINGTSIDSSTSEKLEISGTQMGKLTVTDCKLGEIAATRLSSTDLRLVLTSVVRLLAVECSFTTLYSDQLAAEEATFASSKARNATISITGRTLDLSDCDFDSAQFAQSHIAHINLAKTFARNAKIDGCVFGWAKIDANSSIDNARISGTKIDHLDSALPRTIRLGTDSLSVGDIDADGTRWDDCDFRGVTTTRGSVAVAAFNNCSFVACRFAGISLKESRFVGGRFADCSFDSVNFTGCHVSGVEMSASFRRCDLRGAIFTTINFSGSDFQANDLTAATFHLCRWNKCDLSEAVCGPIKFGEVDGLRMVGTRASGCTFAETAQRVNAGGATLSGAIFTRVKAQDCTFTNARLDKANLNDATFTECDFSGADLSGASVKTTKFLRCSIDSNTKLPQLRPEQLSGLVMKA